MSDMEKICTCGDSEDMHIDAMEHCFNGDCGCREFEEKEVKMTYAELEKYIESLREPHKTSYKEGLVRLRNGLPTAFFTYDENVPIILADTQLATKSPLSSKK